MARRRHGAVAVDLGASSGRFAAGWIEEDRIRFEVIEQVPHAPLERNSRLEWDLQSLLDLCRRAAEYAQAHFDQSTLSIDSWGVDHGFLDGEGRLIGAPVCYRDASHVQAFEALKPHRAELYALTGIQHQPFNTICQLRARSSEGLNPQHRWLILPDLLGYLLTGATNYEQTQASTTQLMGVDGSWSKRAFEIAGWPVPADVPRQPGSRIGEVLPGVELAMVGSHDTASAVAGFGELTDVDMFLNVGTWSLAGVVLDKPIASPEAEAANFTNEWTVDGRVRFLKNIPGFWVINRLHEELGVRSSVPQWLAEANLGAERRLDMFNPDLFNPESMLRACTALLGSEPKEEREWAGIALCSLASAISDQVQPLQDLTGRTLCRIRVGGGGSQSEAFCQVLAKVSGLEVVAGPAEATVLGNLAVALLASGQIRDRDEMNRLLAASANSRSYGLGAIA